MSLAQAQLDHPGCSFSEAFTQHFNTQRPQPNGPLRGLGVRRQTHRWGSCSAYHTCLLSHPPQHPCAAGAWLGWGTDLNFLLRALSSQDPAPPGAEALSHGPRASCALCSPLVGSHR